MNKTEKQEIEQKIKNLKKTSEHLEGDELKEMLVYISSLELLAAESDIEKAVEKIEQSDEGLNKKCIKQRSGLKICSVNGNYVRREYYSDMTMGGHYYVSGEYKFIPEDEIWIDENLAGKPKDFQATVLHEMTERNLMKETGMSYNDAHEVARVVEERYRKEDKELKMDEVEKIANDALEQSRKNQVIEKKQEGEQEIKSTPEQHIKKYFDENAKDGKISKFDWAAHVSSLDNEYQSTIRKTFKKLREQEYIDVDMEDEYYSWNASKQLPEAELKPTPDTNEELIKNWFLAGHGTHTVFEWGQYLYNIENEYEKSQLKKAFTKLMNAGKIKKQKDNYVWKEAAEAVEQMSYEKALENFINRLTEREIEYTSGENWHRDDKDKGYYVFSVEKGQKYDRILATSDFGKGQGSAYAFINKETGGIMKPATWRAPEPKHYEHGNIYNVDPLKGTTRHGVVYMMDEGGEINSEFRIRNSELKAVFEKYPSEYNIYAVVAETKNQLCRIFVRAQAFYENNNFKNKVFSLDEFKKWYSKGDEFTYYDDWRGFNIPDYSIKNFIKKFKTKSVGEKWLAKNIKAKVDMSNPFYIVGYAQGYEDTKKHELSHALYYLQPEYKKAADEVINSIPENILVSLRKFLKTRNYSKKVYPDEMQAYILADKQFMSEQNAWREEYQPYSDKLNKIFNKYFSEQFSEGGEIENNKIEIPESIEYKRKDYDVQNENGEYFIVINRYYIAANDEYGDSTVEMGIYYDEEEAKDEASSITIGDISDEEKYKNRDWTISVTHDEYKLPVVFDEYGDYDINEKDEEYIIEGEDLESYDVQGRDSEKEEKKDEVSELVNRIVSHYSDKYNCKAAGLWFRQSKYCLIPFKDGFIQLRISEHSPNYENILMSQYKEIDNFFTQLPLDDYHNKKYNEFRQLAESKGLEIQISVDENNFLDAKMVEKLKIYGLLFIVIYYEDDETYQKFIPVNNEFSESHKEISRRIDKNRYDLSNSEYENWDADDFIEEINGKIKELFEEYEEEEPIKFDTNEFANGGNISKAKNIILRSETLQDSFGWDRKIYAVIINEIKAGYIYPTKYFGSRSVINKKKWGFAENHDRTNFFGNVKYFDGISEAQDWSYNKYKYKYGAEEEPELKPDTPITDNRLPITEKIENLKKTLHLFSGEELEEMQNYIESLEMLPQEDDELKIKTSKNVWEVAPDEYFGVEKPHAGIDPSVSTTQLNYMSESAKRNYLNKRLDEKQIIRDKYKEAEKKWEDDLINAYNNKKFTLTDIVANYDNDALPVILNIVNEKTGENISPFKLRVDFEKNGKLINELENKYWKPSKEPYIEPEIKTDVETAIAEISQLYGFSAEAGKFLYTYARQLIKEIKKEDDLGNYDFYDSEVDAKYYTAAKELDFNTKFSKRKPILDVKDFDEGDKIFWYSISDFDTVNDFISAVDARIETRRGVAQGLDLFPEQANIPEYQKKNKGGIIKLTTQQLILMKAYINDLIFKEEILRDPTQVLNKLMVLQYPEIIKSDDGKQIVCDPLFVAVYDYITGAQAVLHYTNSWQMDINMVYPNNRKNYIENMNKLIAVMEEKFPYETEKLLKNIKLT